jgi:hypothetical protein
VVPVFMMVMTAPFVHTPWNLFVGSTCDGDMLWLDKDGTPVDNEKAFGMTDVDGSITGAPGDVVVSNEAITLPNLPATMPCTSFSVGSTAMRCSGGPDLYLNFKVDNNN